MIPLPQLIDRLNSIQWRQQDRITSDAMASIQEHLKLIRSVINRIRTEKELNASEAHGIAQTPGYYTSEYKKILDLLFNCVSFEGAGVREPIILAISACYCWNLDSELKTLQNPWPPLVELISIGYTVSNEDSADGETTSLLVGYKNSRAVFFIA